MDDTRRCPYCGEEIRAEAIRCRYCRSRLTGLDPAAWHRDHPERRLAGVAAAVARALTLPVNVVRVGFIVLTFFHLLGPVIYGALWAMIPFTPGGESFAERLIAAVRDLVGHGSGSRHADAAPTPGRNNDGDSEQTSHLPVSSLL